MTLGACGGSKLGGTGTGGAGGTGVGGFGGFETGGYPSGGSGWGGGTTGEGGNIGTGGDFGTGGYGWGGSPGTGSFATGGGPGTGGIGILLPRWRNMLGTDDWPPRHIGFAPPFRVDAHRSSGRCRFQRRRRRGRHRRAAPAPPLCRSVPAVYPGTACTGMASLRSTASGPVIVFGDGSELIWDGTLSSALEPYVQQANGGGDTVWVDYEKKLTVISAFCGVYTTYTLEIRNGQSGKIRFYDQQGVALPNLTDAQVMDIFGTTATARRKLHVPDDTRLLHLPALRVRPQLATTPPQTILDARLTRDHHHPMGSFEVIWASSARILRTRATSATVRTCDPGGRHRQRIRRRARRRPV